MRIDINLATQPYQDSRRFWTQWGTVLALLGAMTALLAFLAVTGFIRAQADRRQMAALKSQIGAYDVEKSEAIGLLNQPQNREMREQSRFLNELFQRKALSWTRVFEDLERVMPAHLRVLSIHPDLAGDNNVEIKLLVGGDSLEQAQDNKMNLVCRKLMLQPGQEMLGTDLAPAIESPGLGHGLA